MPAESASEHVNCNTVSALYYGVVGEHPTVVQGAVIYNLDGEAGDDSNA
jgi:hypothetical protein